MTSSIVSVDSDLCDRSDVIPQNTERVLAQLKCPVCLHFVRREIEGQLCENNHYCCNACLPSRRNCTLCQSTTWIECPSNISLVILHDEITSCIYENKTQYFEGCGVKDRYETLVDGHEKRCSGRLVTCPGRSISIMNCDFDAQPIQKLAKHMRVICPYIGRVSYDDILA
jgi:hypothetical protein